MSSPPDLATGPRILLAVDVNCFYASAHALHDPSLRDIPIGVLQRGFVATTSYEARALGAPKCGPVREVKEACPSITLIRQNMNLYKRDSRKIWDVAAAFFQATFGPVQGKLIPMEKTGIDETLFDLSPVVVDDDDEQEVDVDPRVLHVVRVFGDGHSSRLSSTFRRAATVAVGLQREIRELTGFPVSVGLGSNRTVAKQACKGWNEPGEAKAPGPHVSIIPPQENATALAGVALKHIAGIGREVARGLDAVGVRTCADLDGASWEAIRSAVPSDGRDVLSLLAQLATGDDDRPVKQSSSQPASVSSESFATGLDSPKQLFTFLGALAELLGVRLEEDQIEYRRAPRLLSLKARLSSDSSDSKSLSRSVELPRVRCDRQEISRVIFDATVGLLRKGLVGDLSLFAFPDTHRTMPKIIIRGLGLSASNFDVGVQQERSISDLMFRPTAAGSAVEHDEGAIAVETRLRVVLERTGGFSLNDIPPFRAYDASTGRLTFAEQDASQTAADGGSAAGVSDRPVAKRKRPELSSDTDRPAFNADIGGLQSCPPSPPPLVKGLEGYHICGECATRFRDERDLRTHEDFHLAMSVSEELNGSTPKRPKPAGPQLATTAAAGRTITDFFPRRRA
jgi:DNA polymerase IV